MTRTKPITANPLDRSDNFRCLLLADFGFSTEYIRKETGLTPSQVSYRVRKYGIKRKYYRDGTSLGAKAVMGQAMHEVEPKMKRALTQVLRER
jgi:hypothetical protein